MKPAGPRISVIIPTYQNAAELPRAVRSALAQDLAAIEVIIIDNASTDDTPQVCADLAQQDARVRVLRLDVNAGPAGARNAGAKIAREEFLAFLDADDEWLPGKLAEQVAVLDAQPALALAFCDGVLLDEQSGEETPISVINKVFQKRVTFTPLDAERRVYRLDGDLRAEIYRGNFINLSTVVLRRADFEQQGGFDPACYGMEDLDLWLRLAARGPFAYWYAPKVICHWRPASMSRMTEPRIRKLIGYYLRCLHDPAFADVIDTTRQNLYFCYKQLIILFAYQWRPLRALHAFRESLRVCFSPGLLVYALLSILGPLPILFKLYVINRLFRKQTTPA